VHSEGGEREEDGGEEGGEVEEGREEEEEEREEDGGEGEAEVEAERGLAEQVHSGGERADGGEEGGEVEQEPEREGMAEEVDRGGEEYQQSGGEEEGRQCHTAIDHDAEPNEAVADKGQKETANQKDKGEGGEERRSQNEVGGAEEVGAWPQDGDRIAGASSAAQLPTLGRKKTGKAVVRGKAPSMQERQKIKAEDKLLQFCWRRPLKKNEGR